MPVMPVMALSCHMVRLGLLVAQALIVHFDLRLRLAVDDDIYEPLCVQL
jgi:hypothetical protein